MSWQRQRCASAVRLSASQRNVVAGTNDMKSKHAQGAQNPIQLRLHGKLGHDRRRLSGDSGFGHERLQNRVVLHLRQSVRAEGFDVKGDC